MANYERSLKLKPDAAMYAMRGSVHHGQKDYATAKADYLEALKLNAGEHAALNNLAWLQATCPDAEYRDGESAVKLATKVCELTKWRVKAYASTTSTRVSSVPACCLMSASSGTRALRWRIHL